MISQCGSLLLIALLFGGALAPDSPKDRNFVQSLSKGLRVLLHLGERNEPVSLSELARALETDKTTATRLCHTLEEMGFVWRDENKKYHLTLKVLSLGYSAISQLGWREIADTHLRVFHNDIGEGVDLSVLEDDQALRLLRYPGKRFDASSYRVGMKLPVYCTAQGKVLIAMSSPKVANPILEKIKFRPLTPHTITNMEDFQKELKKIRKNGYAIAYEEFSIGIAAVAAPVLDANKNAFAAVNVGVLTQYYSLEELQQTMAPRVQEAAGQISKALANVEWNKFNDGG